MAESNPSLKDDEQNPFLKLVPSKVVSEKDEQNPFLKFVPSQSEKKKMSSKEINDFYSNIEPMDIISKKIQSVGSILGGDISNALFGIGQMMMAAPSEFGGIASQLKNDRSRFARAVGLAAPAKVANAFINTPPMIGHLLHHYGLGPDVLGKMPYADFSKEIQEKLIGGPKQPGDTLESNWPIIMQLMSGVKRIARGAPPPGGLSTPPELTAATEAHTQAERAAQKVGVPKSPELIEHRIGEQNERIKGIDNEISGLTEKINEVKVPHVEKGREEPFEHVDNLNRAASEEKNNVTHAEALHQNAVHTSENIENDIGQHLDTGAEHHVRAANLLKTDLEHLHAQNNQNYTNLTNQLEPLHIGIENTARIQQINNRITELISQHEYNSPEIQNLGRELLEISHSPQIPATRYVNAYKSLKGYVRDAYERAYERGANREEQETWRQRAEEMNGRLNEMENVLQRTLPNDIYNNLKNADSFWRKNILPLYSERLYWNIMDVNQKKLPKHMAEAFSGGETGSGKYLLNRIARNNPQVLKHIIGERWDAGTASRRNILNPNERMRSYLNDMPELSGLVQNHQRTQATVNNAEQAVQGAKFHHKVIEDRLSNAKKISEREQGAIDKSVAQRKEKMEEKEKYQQSVSEKKAERDKIKKSIEQDIMHLENLTKTRDKKESLEKSFTAQKEINKKKKEIAKKVSGWRTAGRIGKGMMIGDFGIRELKRLLKHFED